MSRDSGGVASRAPATGALPPPPGEEAVLLQAASLLLDYPGPGGAEDLALVEAALAEAPRSPARLKLQRFLSWWRAMSDGERERTYVATFDLDRAVTLYVTEGRPRTSRERGAALLALRRAYADLGAGVARDELPDYLPLMLEVAAHVPPARALLGAERPALVDLAASLARRESPFGLVVAAILAALADETEAGRP